MEIDEQIAKRMSLIAELDSQILYWQAEKQKLSIEVLAAGRIVLAWQEFCMWWRRKIITLRPNQENSNVR
jgi:hypothetical protein